jgi:hypothetical protein
LDPDALNDDGTPIVSEVLIGALTSKTLDDLFIGELQGILSDTSGEVEWAIFEGETAEEALAAALADTDEVPTSSESGMWTSGRNPTDYVRVANHALYIRLKSTNRWAMEAIRMTIESRGKTRARKGR